MDLVRLPTLLLSVLTLASCAGRPSPAPPPLEEPAPVAVDGYAEAQRLASEAAHAAEAGDHRRAKAAYLAAWRAWHPNGEALYRAGRAARALGQRDEARQLFDRAIDELERAVHAPVRLDAPAGFREEGAGARWGRDGSLVVAHGPWIEVIEGGARRAHVAMRLAGEGWVSAFGASDDGRWIAAGSSLVGAVSVFDARDGEAAFALEGHGGPVTAIAFSPDGSRIVSGGSDRTVRVWSFAERREVASIAVRNPVTDVVFARDGSSFFVAYGVTAERYDARTLEPTVQVYVPFSAVELRTQYAPEQPHPPRRVTAIALPADAATLAVASADGHVYVFAMPAGRLLTTLSLRCLRLERDVCVTSSFVPGALALSGDGRSVVAGGYHGEMVRWALPSGAEAWQKATYSGPVRSISESPDGQRLVTTSDTGEVTFRDERFAPIGVATPVLRCSFGGLDYPYELCAHRFPAPELSPAPSP